MMLDHSLPVFESLLERKMNAIKTFIDADALSGLALIGASLDVASLIRKQGIELVTSDLMVQEVLRTGCSSRRILIAQLIVDLLQDRAILATLSQQIRWSSIDFAEGELAFRPYRTAKEDWVKRKLIKADSITRE
jgi:hypothetical protein